MSFATQLAQYVAIAPTANSVQADISSAISTCKSSLETVLISTVGLASGSPPIIAIEEALLHLAERCAKESAG